MTSAWSDERILSFIEMYRNRPVLWDIRLNEHKDKRQRSVALLELAEHFGVSKEEVERKIKNLLSHYSRELKKIELGKSCPDYRYKSKWFCFASMQFLDERHKPNKSSDGSILDAGPRGPRFYGPDFQSIKAEDSDPEIISLSDGQDCDPLAEMSPSPQPQPVEMYLSPDQTFSFALTEERRQGNTSSVSEDDTLTLLREINTLRQEKDEYSLFGEQVAVKLRKLASPYARIMVQHIINTTLFEAEMGKYDEPAAMALTLPTFVQPRKDCAATPTSHHEPKRQRLNLG